MADEKIKVVAYSGYRGEERPKAIFLKNQEIEIIEILSLWVEEGINDKARKRYFIVKERGGSIQKIYYDEKAKEWFLTKN
ncbi:MAG: hypothetical protein A2Y97_00540 [Nitrospirae bacterium RBG_13_39_12]|nr:MAG: hypothetical protein A2Y97_00540 [Nitrospirae bacterium RBG_13_39_12]